VGLPRLSRISRAWIASMMVSLMRTTVGAKRRKGKADGERKSGAPADEPDSDSNCRDQGAGSSRAEVRLHAKTGNPATAAGTHQPGLGGSQDGACKRLPGWFRAFSSVDAPPPLACRLPHGPIHRTESRCRDFGLDMVFIGPRLDGS